MNRDSTLLRITHIASLILLAITNAISLSGPEHLGLSDVTAHWLTLLSGIATSITGWLSSSPLPGKADDNRVTPPKDR